MTACERDLVTSVDFSMTDGGVVGKVGILRLLSGLVILKTTVLRFRPFGASASGCAALSVVVQRGHGEVDDLA